MHSPSVVGVNCEGRPFVIDDRAAEALATQLIHRLRRPPETPKNQYGGKVTIKYDPTTAEKLRGYTRQETPIAWESPDKEPRSVTVEVGRLASGGTFPRRTDAAGNVLSYRPVAHVTLASPAATMDAFTMDIGRGQTFTTAASYVAVTVAMLAPRVDILAASPPVTYVSGSMTVVARLVTGAVGLSEAPVYTQYFDRLQSGNPQTVAIPARARALLPVRSGVAFSEIEIAFLDAANNVIDIFVFDSGTMVAPAYLSGDAQQVRLTNNNAAATTSFRLVWQLSI